MASPDDSDAPQQLFLPPGYRFVRGVCKFGFVIALIVCFLSAGSPGAVTALFGFLLSVVAIDILLELRSWRPKQG
ncbi:hypothetical protein [Blastopirellula marina]|uniref:Uncharacterized protein n=1 Tax=Blastopirellula marina TaxID=124 RepID=A0A2S8GJM6_9BACT|nr:hypothetical protein [Blastopirellula marina]PQO44214.1 hypothetical protein C5Y93_19775 [Blastopirellula marina]